MDNDNKIKKVELEDGKYTVLHHEEHGGITVLRYDEPWRNETGDKLMLAMFHETQKLQAFYNYFRELYGEGLGVTSWHMNGDVEPFDNFFDNAEREMDN